MQGAAATTPDLDLAHPTVLSDPYPAFAALRKHRVRWVDGLRSWAAADYRSVAQLARSASLVRVTGPVADGADTDRTLQRVEGPDHERLRSTVADVFHGDALRRLRPWIAAVADELVAGCADSGAVDLMSDLAHPLSMRVVGHVLGLPDEDLAPLARWTAVIAAAMGMPPTSPFVSAAATARRHVTETIARLSEARRRRPHDDLVTRLVHDPRLSPGEARAMVRLLVFTASHPTALAIGNALLVLSRHPDQWDAMAWQPDALHRAVEECLRFEPVIKLVSRRAVAEIEVAGKVVRPGDQVVLLYAAANRDERVFPRGSTFDIARSPNPHLAFGRGVHACLGPGLARLELEVTLECLLRRRLAVRLAGEPAALVSPVLRGLERLPARLVSSRHRSPRGKEVSAVYEWP